MARGRVNDNARRSKRRVDLVPYTKEHNGKVAIMDNILINNGYVTAYYLMYPYNYGVMDLKSAERHVDRIYAAMNTMYGTFGEMHMSMFNLHAIVSKEDTIKKIVETVGIYRKDYTSMPEGYQKYIRNISRDFTILAVRIDPKSAVDIENQSALNILKGMLENVIRDNLSTTVVSVDEAAMRKQSVRIRDSLQRYAVPASTRLVMNIYVNSIFPSYNLVYNDWMVEHSASILAGIRQEVIPHLGWFEMSNSGIVAFGGEPRVTYGSVLTITEFPESIYSENFNIAIPGMHVNMHLLPKTKAELKFKRIRADAKQEAEDATFAQTDDSDVDESVDLVQRALYSIRQGRIATEVDANILIVADTREDLESKKKHAISVLSDVNVVCTIAGNQARTWLQSFVRNRPLNGYYHTMDLQYALSFQMDAGLSCGDADSKYASPVIGIG